MTRNSASTQAHPPEWRNFVSVYEKLGPPLRPAPSDVAVARGALPSSNARIALLGVTPELSILGSDLTAFDNSARMLARIWPGDGPNRRAVLSDWTSLPLANSSVDAVIGDGSLNSAPERIEDVFAEMRRVIAPGGRAIMRTFCSPPVAEPLEAIAQDVKSGWLGNVHALKWRIAMSLAAGLPRATVPVCSILAAFDRMFPDRNWLAAATGWSRVEIATLDAYSGAEHSLGFETLERILDLGAAHFNSASVVTAGGYPLADRCPTITWNVG